MTTLREKIGQMIIMGFQGTSKDDPGVQAMCSQLKDGLASGVILFRYNIESPSQVKNLAATLKQAAEIPAFISVDQEGGQVQRLSPKNGFTAYPSAQSIAQMALKEALEWYTKLAMELQAHHINFDFAPCVDVNPLGFKCPVIGDLQRSYSSDPGKVIQYANLMIEAFKKAGVANCIKHFPGHGSAKGDSHEGYVDVSETWKGRELIPFMELVKMGNVDSVMTAHIFNENLDKNNPATLSKPTLDKLRHAGFDGVIITDDLHMGAIQQHYKLKDAVIGSINAGCDMFILSNNKAAAMGVDGFEPDPMIGKKVVDLIAQAIDDGDILESRIDESFQRVVTLKKTRLATARENLK